MNRFQFPETVFRSFNDLANDIFNETPQKSRSFFPRTNIFETNDDFQVEMLVPGRIKEDFRISLDKNLLTVAYEAKEEKEEEERKALKKEFSFRSFERAFSIDEKIDTDAIEAKYENGILTLSLPKKEEVKVLPKEIAVQ